MTDDNGDGRGKRYGSALRSARGALGNLVESLLTVGSFTPDGSRLG